MKRLYTLSLSFLAILGASAQITIGLNEMPSALYRGRYPAMKTLDAFYGPPGGPALENADFTGVPPENNLVARNISVGKWLRVDWHATPLMLKLENNLTNAEPGFVGRIDDRATANDFALKKDSPAWALGFQRIPVEKIGPQGLAK